MDLPKYSKAEIERRWLIDPAATIDLSITTSRLIEDWYIAGTHLRLRRESADQGSPFIWKLCKKYGQPEEFRQPIVNVYVDEAEYTLLRSLPGRSLRKRRHGKPSYGPLKIDVFELDLTGHRSCEFESEDWNAVKAFRPPPWVGPEITDNAQFSGGTLAGSSFDDLKPLIEAILVRSRA